MTTLAPGNDEAALDHPDKVQMGTFGQTTSFDSHLDEAGVSISLHRINAIDLHKSLHVHLHYGLFAEILCDLAKKVGRLPPAGSAHRGALRDAAKALCVALGADAPESEGTRDMEAGGDVSKLTPDEEVLLLHVLE